MQILFPLTGTLLRFGILGKAKDCTILSLILKKVFDK
jgi:hypothetical protein